MCIGDEEGLDALRGRTSGLVCIPHAVVVPLLTHGIITASCSIATVKLHDCLRTFDVKIIQIFSAPTPP